jgi:exonuclease III
MPKNVIKPATLHKNGITAQTRVGMLADFIRRHDIDILYVQEVMSTEVLNIRVYETHQNNGASFHGTAILATQGLQLTNITTLPFGRAIRAVYQGIQLINLYAPSGKAKRNDRKVFQCRAAISAPNTP